MRMLLAALAFASIAVACETSSTPAPATSGGGDAGDAEAAADAAAPGSPCAATRAYVERCGGEDALNCGASGFDAWCEANDRAVNSDAYRRAEDKCISPELACDADARRACEYASYADATPTSAQRALVDAYCATCEPDDAAACATRATTYDAAAGPKSVSDIFIAAWELADPIVDSIRTKCTGGALDAGADCAAAFSSCAAGPYLDAVPDCP